MIFVFERVQKINSDTFITQNYTIFSEKIKLFLEEN